MSYRIHGIRQNGDRTQLFGNNVCPTFVMKELERQGCKIDSDGCFDAFEIKDIQYLIEATERYIISEDILHKSRKYNPSNIFDLTLDDKQKENMTLSLKELQENAYIFTSANIVRFFEDDLDLAYDKGKGQLIWKIKKGHKIYLEAY